MKKITFLLMILLTGVFSAQTFIPTFHNVSVYWSPSGGSLLQKCNVEYKVAGTEFWNNALDMNFNSIEDVGLNSNTNKRFDLEDYRGTIANLSPNTTYDIKLTLENSTETIIGQCTTWNESFNIAQTTIPDVVQLNLNHKYIIDGATSSGSSTGGYHLIDGSNITIDAHYVYNGNSGEQNYCIYIHDAEYIIIRGFNLVNAGKFGVLLDNCRNVIIEDCSISNWGDEDPGTGFGKATRGGIYSINGLQECIIQRNKIYNPRWSANSWAVLHDPNSDPTILDNFHPNGPQAIFVSYSSGSNNVVRYNEFYSVNGNRYDDVIGGSTNASHTGFLGGDSDIYGNYIANSFDDGIEVEGGNRNVRVWNNYIEDVFVGIGNAPTSIGPLYLWRNVMGRSFSPVGSKFGEFGNFLKMGTSNSGSGNWMRGHIYLFNNTIYQENNDGAGGIGTRLNTDGSVSNRITRHCYTRNNILEVRDANVLNSISIRSGGLPTPNFDNNYNFDLLNGAYPNGYESDGIEGSPVYNNSPPLFDFNTKTGQYFLSTQSLGFDQGKVIPNFIYVYNGLAPDIGAYESDTPPTVYGVNATTVNFPLNTSIEEELNSEVRIFPNPFINEFVIKFENKKIEQVEVLVFNAIGEIVHQSKKVKNKTVLVKTEGLSKGVYIVVVKTNQQMMTKKLLKID